MRCLFMWIIRTRTRKYLASGHIGDVSFPRPVARTLRAFFGKGHNFAIY